MTDRPTRLLFGTVMLSAASVSKIALQFVLVPILARLLGPNVFGLMSVAMSLVFFVNIISEGGMGAALVRDQCANQELKSTIFWLSLLSGCVLAVMVCLLSWPIAIAFSQPGMVPVLCALSPILILSAALPVSNAQIMQRQRLELFAVGDFVCVLFSASVGIAMAYWGFGIWSLVTQQLLLWSAKAIWVFWVARFRPSLVLRVRLARPLLGFSGNNLAASIADFAGKSAPLMIVSALLGMAAAGHYAMAYQFTRVADQMISSPVNIATFSAVAVAANTEASASFVTTVMRLLTMVLAPLCSGLMLTADLIAPVLLGPKWIETASALAALAPGAFLVCIYSFVSSALLGTGRSGQVFRLTLLSGLSVSGATFLGAHFGMIWAAIGFSTGLAILAPVFVWHLSRALNVRVSQLVGSMSPGLVATAVMSAVVLSLRWRLHDVSELDQLIVCVLTGVLAFGAAALLIDGRQLKEDIVRIRLSWAGAAPSSAAAPTQAIPGVSEI